MTPKMKMSRKMNKIQKIKMTPEMKRKTKTKTTLKMADRVWKKDKTLGYLTPQTTFAK